MVTMSHHYYINTGRPARINLPRGFPPTKITSNKVSHPTGTGLIARVATHGESRSHGKSLGAEHIEYGRERLQRVSNTGCRFR